MRKYFLGLVVFFLLAGFFSVYYVGISQAEERKVGETCQGDEKKPEKPACGEDGICVEANNCGPGLVCDKGICASLQSSEQLKCVCDKPGVNGRGNNGFKCGKDGNVAGQPTVYCNDADNACYPLNDTDPKKNIVDDTKISRGSNYPGQTLTGVVCQGVKNIAECTCSGKNSLECKLVEVKEGGKESDKPGQKATAKCKKDGDTCIAAPGQFGEMSLFKDYTGFLEPDSIKNFFGANTGGIIRGATCGQPPLQCTCMTPGRAGPRVNGFTCIRNVGPDGTTQKDIDFCENSDLACIQKDPNFVMTKKTENKIFNDSVLKGIDCEKKDREPPPKPPCARGVAIDKDGKCLAFDSAFGQIRTDAGAFITSIFSVLLAFSGGIALLLIMRAGYIIMTSSGNQEKVNAGREQFTSAIVGLLFIIFSFVILQVIGVDLLRLPGFGAAGDGGAPTGVSSGSSCNAAGTGGFSCPAGETCVAGVCKASTNAACDVNAATSQCPTGQTCVSDGTGNGRSGRCQ